MADFGQKVSKLGEDVNTAAVRNLTTDSEHPVLKSKLGQSPKHFDAFNIPLPIVPRLPNEAVEEYTIATIPHGYPYIPAVFGLYGLNGPYGVYPNNYPNATKDTWGSLDDSFYRGFNSTIFADLTVLDHIDMFADATNMYITITVHGDRYSPIVPDFKFYSQFFYDGNIVGKYYIFDENAD